ncbi:MAG: TetR/AcrR family transcriptional regulator [Shimia sp.]|nr:TetR/AcrR family transcriptional regulator [Shimia sp.]
MKSDPSPKNRASEDHWLDAAYDILTEGGVEAVKIMPLAKRLGVSRTGFYWHFKDRDALLEAMVQRWELKNSGNLIARTEAYADSLAEAMFNLFDCWLDSDLFDAKLDLAIRNWARVDSDLQMRLDRSDQSREDAVAAMFCRFGHSQNQARVRARTVMYTQIGYLSMRVKEDLSTRLGQMPQYVEVFTGEPPSEAETQRFLSRHNQQ